MRGADLQVGVDDAVAVQIVGGGLAVPSRVVPDRIVLTKTQKVKRKLYLFMVFLVNK